MFLTLTRLRLKLLLMEVLIPSNVLTRLRVFTCAETRTIVVTPLGSLLSRSIRQRGETFLIRPLGTLLNAMTVTWNRRLVLAVGSLSETIVCPDVGLSRVEVSVVIPVVVAFLGKLSELTVLHVLFTLLVLFVPPVL